MLNVQYRILNIEVGLLLNSKFDIQNSAFNIFFVISLHGFLFRDLITQEDKVMLLLSFFSSSRVFTNPPGRTFTVSFFDPTGWEKPGGSAHNKPPPMGALPPVWLPVSLCPGGGGGTWASKLVVVAADAIITSIIIIDFFIFI